MAPPAFTELDFEAALERSRMNQSILIVDAMAAWCAPCRQMDTTTWTDAAVVARLTGEASSFAIQLDVDDEADLEYEAESVDDSVEMTAALTALGRADRANRSRVLEDRTGVVT